MGLIIPILKPGKDPNLASSYRPITLSSVTSKIVELYILDQLPIASELYNQLMFGFIPSRGTTMAAALAHDVVTYMNYNGSAVFLCSLDAQGAFDYIPHASLFYKCMNIIPDMSWNLLKAWYSAMSVRVLWAGQLGSPISVQRGTRQGGITSPALFNIFYKDLIDKLSQEKCGVQIGDRQYNVMNYADDVLLLSTSVSGLQTLINTATQTIGEQGLHFNPAKTVLHWWKMPIPNAPNMDN